MLLMRCQAALSQANDQGNSLFRYAGFPGP